MGSGLVRPQRSRSPVAIVPSSVASGVATRSVVVGGGELPPAARGFQCARG